MKILVFGALNLDFVYQVEHIAMPGETISSDSLEVYPGGKGLNQSVALAKAGAPVYIAGNIGPDGDLLLDTCDENGVNRSMLKQVETRSGNAIIQVDKKGQNSIVLFGGANRKNTAEYIDIVLENFGAGDYILLQNEINLLDEIIEKAETKGMKIALNPSPFDSEFKNYDFGKISLLLLNEIEGMQLTGHTDPEKILDYLSKKYPRLDLLLTLGKFGAIFQTSGKRFYHGIYDMPVVDTTAAGDTFTGFFLTSYILGHSPEESLENASLASALAISRTGAASSIPTKEEVQNNKHKLKRIDYYFDL